MRMIIYYSAIIALLFVIHWLFPIFKPFLIGAFFAAILQKPSRFIQRKGSVSRGTAVFMSLFLIFVFFFSAAALFGLIGARTLAHFHSVIPQYIPIAVMHIEQLINGIASFLTPEQNKALLQLIHSLDNSAEHYAGEWILSSTFFLLAIPGAAAETLIAILAAFFLAKDGQLLIKKLPDDLQKKFKRAVSDFSSSFFSYTHAQIQLFIITFLAACAGFFFLGMPHIIELAFLTAVLEFVPIIGSSLLFVPWILFCFLTGQLKIAVFAAILYAVLAIMRQLLEPKLVSDSAGLHPLAVIFSVFAGYHLLGPFGIAAGPILLLACLSVYRSGLLFTKR